MARAGVAWFSLVIRIRLVCAASDRGEGEMSSNTVLVDAIDRVTRNHPPSSGLMPLPSPDEAPGAVSEVRNKLTIADSESDVPYQSWHSIVAFLTQLGELAAHPRQVDAVLREVLDNFLGAAGFPSGSAYLITGEDDLELRAHVGPPEASSEALATFFGHKPYLESIVRRHMPVVLGGPVVSTEERAILDASGAGAKLVMPLVLNGRALGVTVLSSPSRETRPDLTAMARAIAGPVTQAVALALAMSELDRSEHRLRSIAETVGDGVLVTDDAGRIVYANSAAVRLLSIESIAGCRIADLLPFFDFNGPLLQQGVVSPPARDPCSIEAVCQAFGDGSAGAARIYAVRDLTQRFQLVELERLANHDSLTGLSNRRRFDEDLATRVQEGWRHGVSTSLVLMDLDNFKTINDTWGHAAGDEMLRAVGRVLRRVTRRSDLPARLGGDEFAVLLSHTGASGALACTHKLHARLAAEKVEIGGHIVPIIASIGAAAFPAHAASGSALVEAADRALYCAKRQGRNRVCLADDLANTQRLF